jgi:hypothetical protein
VPTASPLIPFLKRTWRRPVQLFKPLSYLTPAHFSIITIFTVRAVDSQAGQQVTDPASHVPNLAGLGSFASGGAASLGRNCSSGRRDVLLMPHHWARHVSEMRHMLMCGDRQEPQRNPDVITQPAVCLKMFCFRTYVTKRTHHIRYTPPWAFWHPEQVDEAEAGCAGEQPARNTRASSYRCATDGNLRDGWLG